MHYSLLRCATWSINIAYMKEKFPAHVRNHLYLPQLNMNRSLSMLIHKTMLFTQVISDHNHQIYKYGMILPRIAGWCTVEQEHFTTGKFHEIAASGVSQQENFANFQLEDFLKHSIFMTGNFRESAKICKNFLHANISCFTVPKLPMKLKERDPRFLVQLFRGTPESGYPWAWDQRATSHSEEA